VTDFSLSPDFIEKKNAKTELSQVDEFYKRKLPHWQPEDTWVFVTWRLAGSEPRVPAMAAASLSEGERFELMDRVADCAGDGPLWLADPRIAQIVRDELFGGSSYELGAWVIMSNHVHIVILPRIPLRKIMQRLKGRTAYQANRLLGRTCKFWKDESYDHWIRSQEALNRVIRYVERNPVKAGLIDSIEHWRWSSAWLRTD
jgi:REP element-mobilizing transposase RayT